MEKINLKIKELFQNASENINSISFGYKEKNGQITDKLSIIYTVKNKKSKNLIPAEELIPEFINIDNYDYPTDVIESQEAKILGCYSFETDVHPLVQEHRKKIRPLRGGISLTSSANCGFYDIGSGLEYVRPYKYGTLGAIVVDDVTNTLVGLTAGHVMAKDISFGHIRNFNTGFYNIHSPVELKTYELSDNNLLLTDALTDVKYQQVMIQFNETGEYANLYSNDVIGEPKRYIPALTGNYLNSGDAGIFTLQPGSIEITGSEQQLNLSTASGLLFANSTEIYDAFTGRKSLYSAGRTTGPKGDNCPLFIHSLNGSAAVNGYEINGIPNQSLSFENVLAIKYQNYTDDPAAEGDSGSVIYGDFDGTKKIVGLIFASANATTAYACSIDKIASALKISPWTGQVKNFDNPATKKTFLTSSNETGVYLNTLGQDYSQVGIISSFENLKDEDSSEDINLDSVSVSSLIGSMNYNYLKAFFQGSIVNTKGENIEYVKNGGLVYYELTINRTDAFDLYYKNLDLENLRQIVENPDTSLENFCNATGITSVKLERYTNFAIIKPNGDFTVEIDFKTLPSYYNTNQSLCISLEVIDIFVGNSENFNSLISDALKNFSSSQGGYVTPLGLWNGTDVNLWDENFKNSLLDSYFRIQPQKLKTTKQVDNYNSKVTIAVLSRWPYGAPPPEQPETDQIVPTQTPFPNSPASSPTITSAPEQSGESPGGNMSVSTGGDPTTEEPPDSEEEEDSSGLGCCEKTITFSESDVELSPIAFCRTVGVAMRMVISVNLSLKNIDKRLKCESTRLSAYLTIPGVAFNKPIGPYISLLQAPTWKGEAEFILTPTQFARMSANPGIPVTVTIKGIYNNNLLAPCGDEDLRNLKLFYGPQQLPTLKKIIKWDNIIEASNEVMGPHCYGTVIVDGTPSPAPCCQCCETLGGGGTTVWIDQCPPSLTAYPECAPDRVIQRAGGLYVEDPNLCQQTNRIQASPNGIQYPCEKGVKTCIPCRPLTCQECSAGVEPLSVLNIGPLGLESFIETSESLEEEFFKNILNELI